MTATRSDNVAVVGPTGASSRSERRGMPAWLSFALIGAALAGGGWGVWKFWTGLATAGSGQTVTLDEKPSEYYRTQFGDRMRVRQVQQTNDLLSAPDFIRERPRGQGGGWEAKGNRTRLIITRASANAAPRLQAESLDPAFISTEQRQLLLLRARATNEDAVARHLTLTEDQRKQLNAVPRGISYAIDDATRKKLEALFTAWQSAPDADKPAKATELTNTVRELETAAAGPAKADAARRADLVKSIVTAEQIKLFSEMGRAGR